MRLQAVPAAPLVTLLALLAMLPARAPALARSQASSPSAPVLSYRVLHAYPHDPNAFTQGLEYADGILYEGTGLNGHSSIRKVTLDTGRVVQERRVSSKYFGEGITIWKSSLFELTWETGVAFVYDRATFTPLRRFSYAGEGWGLTHDATNLIMSDGTSRLRLLDPATFAERRRISVTDNGEPVRHLNELEYVRGQILANVWLTNRIARIDPGTGRVTGWLDLGGLPRPDEHVSPNAVLNGIAYDAQHDRLFVTGKLWPRLFEIEIEETN